jgi:hypothetical protein
MLPLFIIGMRAQLDLLLIEISATQQPAAQGNSISRRGTPVSLENTDTTDMHPSGSPTSDRVPQHAVQLMSV